jgi:hypothetical protein
MRRQAMTENERQAVLQGVDMAKAYMELTGQDEIPLDKLADFVDAAFTPPENETDRI